MSDNKDFSALIRSQDNHLYRKFLKKFSSKLNDETFDEEYNWKCFLTKKYFMDNFIICVVKFFIGLALLISAVNLNNVLPTLLVIVLMVGGFILFSSSVVFGWGFLKCRINYTDHLWDEENEFSNKIILFYKGMNRKE